MAQPHLPSRILIVDDHPIVRDGYAQLIGNQSDLEVCGSAASEQEALVEVRKRSPQLAIVDITLKDSNGIELIKDLRFRHPHLKILVISAHDENLYAERALEAGALGYINKQEATGKLIDAVRRVLSGDVYVSEAISARLLKRRVGLQNRRDVSAIDQLTDRELQVYQMIGNGQTSKQIAGTLNLSTKTIERYKENIKKKLSIKNATELVQKAARWILETE